MELTPSYALHHFKLMDSGKVKDAAANPTHDPVKKPEPELKDSQGGASAGHLWTRSEVRLGLGLLSDVTSSPDSDS